MVWVGGRGVRRGWWVRRVVVVGLRRAAVDRGRRRVDNVDEELVLLADAGVAGAVGARDVDGVLTGGQADGRERAVAERRRADVERAETAGAVEQLAVGDREARRGLL